MGTRGTSRWGQAIGLLLTGIALGVTPVAIAAAATADVAPLPHALELPAGFRIAVFAEGLHGVRKLAYSPLGDLWASQPERGRIIRLADRNHDGRADEIMPVVADLDRPHGLAWYRGALYVAETGKVLRLDLDAQQQRAVARHRVIDLPSGGMHWTRSLGVGPDGKIYVSVGSSCNACVERDARRAAILRCDPDGGHLTIYARGLRNAVGFGWDPAGQLWAVDNGRDWLGNTLPPEELDRITEGGHYGWPYCYGDRQPDPAFPRPGFCARTTPPAFTLPAHMAPLGLAFYTGHMFPKPYANDLFVTLHGSWNRQPPAGYKVVRIRFRRGQPIAVEDFLTGWLQGQEAWGRPVDVVVAPDGALMISDDAGGRIYRVTYSS